MTKSVLILACVLGVMTVSPVSFASSFYVSPLGADSNAGDKEKPWATLQHAVDSVSPGDEIVVKDGTYEGFRISRSGAEGKPITLRAETLSGNGVAVKGVGAKCTRNSIIEIRAYDDSKDTIEHWIIDGLEVDGTGAEGDCIRPDVTSHVTIRNCRLHDSSFPCIMAGHSDYMVIERIIASGSRKSHGIYMANSADNGVLRGNTSFSNAKCGIHMNGDLSCGGDGLMTGWTVERNVVFDNGSGAGGGGAINCDGVSDSVFRNNLLYNNHRTGMTFYAIDAASGSSRNLVAHNTIIMAADAGWWPVIMPKADGRPSPVGNRFFNNIILPRSPAHGSFAVYASDIEGFQSDHNVIDAKNSINDGDSVVTLETWRSYGYDVHSVIAKPAGLFTDEAKGDYRLKEGSPAIDAGILLKEVPNDIEGTKRNKGKGPDAGCFESF